MKYATMEHISALIRTVPLILECLTFVEIL